MSSRAPYNCVVILLCILLTPFPSYAQKLFSEGIITYKVEVEDEPGKESDKKHTGIYTITLKGKQLKKELKLDNGFSIITLHDATAKTTYTLRQAGDKKYAIHLDNEELKKKAEQFGDFTFVRQVGKKKISGYIGRKGTISYKDSTATSIVFSEQWQTEPFVYDRFPAINVLLLEFTVKTEEGIILHFYVKEIEETPIENSNFKIPEDHTVITNTEYRELK